MRKISFAIMAGIAALAVSSCGTGLHLSNAVNQFGAQTVVTLSQANFRIVRNVEAVIEVNNSNLRRTDVEKSAYAQLLRNANLHGSQALINVVIEEVRRTKPTLLCGPKHKQYVAARATIIEFVDGPAIPSGSYSASTSAPAAVTTSSAPEPAGASEEPVVVDDPQISNNPLKDIDGKIFRVPATGGTFDIHVDAPLKYIRPDVNWINGYVKQRVFFVDPNRSQKERKATVTFTDKDGNKADVVFIQAGK